ncbi:glycerophosphodiester phosphodiesterase family protein [Chitinophaga polysaccharea]|uniref:glycerophosphodiester phosphodiesterase family protein n=1 Tax=Chitinophaga polysaccharea TaxID=1293035 RepID=UPI001455115C|nr:glycerophosphodiester phosphodiesterase family protein [Chitinophaga polysaccharea]NLR62372.1 glycerophosphodiester phosphodiesterase family protein [Chitinophaga polysaccharea]
MKYLLLLFVCSVSLQLYAQQTRPVDAILDEFYHHPEHVMVAAHRAAHTKHPENSLAAIREAIAQGIDIAEIDVHATKDKVLVIMHDDNITRATGKKGKIADYTYQELLQFPLLFNGQPTTEKIPTFEEVLQLTKGKIIVDIDFKEDSIEFAKQTIDMVAAHQMEDQVLFFIYEPPFATQLRSFNARLPIMPRAHNITEINDIERMSTQLGKFPVIHIDDSFYSDTLVQRITSNGTRIWINSLGKYDKMEGRQDNSGFDQLRKDARFANVLQTDYPERLLAYLRQQGLHR